MGRSGVQTEGLLFPFKLQGGCPKASWARLTFPTRYKHHQVTKWLLKKKKDTKTKTSVHVSILEDTDLYKPTHIYVYSIHHTPLNPSKSFIMDTLFFLIK